jgi:hypothetical protein
VTCNLHTFGFFFKSEPLVLDTLEGVDLSGKCTGRIYSEEVWTSEHTTNTEDEADLVRPKNRQLTDSAAFVC